MNQRAQISSRQVVGLLILARLFILLIYVPSTYQVAQGPASLVVTPLGLLFTLAALLPAWFLLKHYRGQDLLDATALIAPKLHRPAAFLFYLLCITVAGETIAQFELFMTTVIYPTASRVYIILIFSAAVLYMVFMGLEAITRASLVVLVMVFFSSLIVFFGLVKYIDLVNIFTPFYDGAKPIVAGTFRVFAQNIETISFLLLLPYFNQSQQPKSEKSYLSFTLITGIILEIVSFLGITVLGNYGKTRTFPMYTMSAISGSEVFYRFDYFHIIIWVSISLIRAALYLFLASRMLGIFAKLKSRRLIYWINFILVTALALASSQNLHLFGGLYEAISSGIPVIILTVLLPTVLLYIRFFKIKKGTLKPGAPFPNQSDTPPLDSSQDGANGQNA